MGLKYISLHGALGYFAAAKRYMLGLVHAGIPLTWTPMVPGKAWGLPLQPYTGRTIGDADLDRYCNTPLDYDTVIVHTAPDLYPRWKSLEADKRLIGYTTWETDKPPRYWIPLLNKMDRLLVPSSWNREVFRSSGVFVPIDALPHIADPAAPAAPEGSVKKTAEPFVFYAIESWTARKNLEKTIHCFLKTFTARDHTRLLVKTTPFLYRQNPLTRLRRLRSLYRKLRRLFRVSLLTSLRPGSAEYLRAIESKYPAPPPIDFLTKEVSEEGIRNIHRQGDCYISLSHAEGWGLGAFDAAARGKPVIITGYGGQMDYLLPDMSYPVDYTLAPVRDDDDPRNFTPDQKWAEPSLEDASKWMRHVYEHRQEARHKGERLQRYVQDTFSEKRIIDRLIRILQNE
jgi:glycosyltransferase involved in cell wall biosynthesis